MILYLVKDNTDTLPAYKRNKIGIGASDVATLIIRTGAKVELLHFGEDNSYHAWYIDDPSVEIPSRYNLITTTKHWLKIYDDVEMTFHEFGDFEIYRAGELGCIIRKVK